MPNVPTTAVQRCVDRLKLNESGAREELMRVAYSRLLTMVRGLMARYPRLRRWEQSDDVLQNVQIRLLRCLDQTPVDTARAFLSLAATNMRRELIDLSRHHFGVEGAGVNHATPAGEGDGPTPVDMKSDPSILAEWAELHERVADLPGEEREVVDLHWYHGFTQQEVAELMGLSLKTVKRRWVAARARLAADLSDGFFEQ